MFANFLGGKSLVSFSHMVNISVKRKKARKKIDENSSVAYNLLMQNRSHQIILIDAEQAGRRLDNFLLSLFSGVPKSLFYRLMRGGQIRVNKKRVKPTYRLEQGDAVKVPRITQDQQQDDYQVKPAFAQALETAIVFEDERFLVLNKPSGMPVHGGTGLSGGVIEALRQIRGPHQYLELAHRLDKETSGCLIIAKKPSILRQFHQLLREGKLKKQYVALTGGHWPKQRNKVALELEKNQLSSGERKVKFSEQGKSALTYFQVETRFSTCDLVKIDLMTGRMHQIRAHGQLMGHPIAGDQKYGDRAFNRLMKKNYGLNRLFLHAEKLAFHLPEDKKSTILHAEIPDSLSQVILALKQRDKKSNNE